jgi:type III pantothenate kinase
VSRWLFDLGNTRLKCAALHDDGGIGEAIAIPHDGIGFATGWSDALPAAIEAAFVASVAPVALRVALLETLALRCGRISRAATQARFDDGTRGGVRIAYAQPGRLGVDRFLALLAARTLATGSWLVVGVGTALTVDLLDDEGCHRGGRIAPSPMLMRRALNARAMQLPETGGTYVEFATDTSDALASGCEGAAAGLVERSLQGAQALLGMRPALLLHGGGAAGLQSHFDEAILAPALVLQGLARWACAGESGSFAQRPAP